jgi:hypothetical protein
MAAAGLEKSVSNTIREKGFMSIQPILHKEAYKLCDS